MKSKPRKIHKKGWDAREKILAFIVAFIAERKIPPTIREITSALGISSTSVTSYHLEKLEREGRIRRVKHPEGKRIERGIIIPAKTRADYKIEYRCTYPARCSTRKDLPGFCSLHGTELILFVERRK